VEYKFTHISSHWVGFQEIILIDWLNEKTSPLCRKSIRHPLSAVEVVSRIEYLPPVYNSCLGISSWFIGDLNSHRIIIEGLIQALYTASQDAGRVSQLYADL